MEVENLYEMLRKTQEAKGYFFNKERERVFELLEALIINKKRYGYMACPCVPVSTGLRMLKNTGAVTAAFMSHRSGTRIKFPMIIFPNEDLLKRFCFR